MTDTERYSRQILLPEVGAEGQARIQNAKVLIVGVGGLGSPIALYLAGAGVGTIGLVDGDVVDRSNLQRQVLYGESEIGQPKAICARRRLAKLNSTIHIDCYPERLDADNAHRLIAAYDIIVDGCDNFATRYLLSDTCAALGKPYVYGAIRAFDGQVAVFCHPKGHATYRTLCPDEAGLLSLPAPPKGVIGVTPGTVGCIQAAEVLKLITGLGTPLIDRLWTIDLRTLQSFIVSL